MKKQKKHPKISILIPTRNRCNLLHQSLDCLGRQSYSNFEVVVVNDCSDDDTLNVVEKFKDRLPGLIYLKNDTQIGASLSFDKAVKHSSGDYVLTFSDDDLLCDGALEEFVASLADADYDLIYSDLSVIDQNGNQTALWVYEEYPDKLKLLRRLLDTGGNVIPEVLLIKRSKYDQVYGELYSRRFITPFYLGALNSLKIGYVNKPLYRYRIHNKSTFSDTSGLIIRNKGVTNFMNLIMFMYPAVEVFEINNRAIVEERIVAAIASYIHRLLTHAQRFLKGTFYTGICYEESDNIWMIFYEYASYWLAIARKYSVHQNILDQLESKIKEKFSLHTYDPIKVNLLPEAYRRLPWFAYRPINKVTEFVAFDMVTLGNNSYLDKHNYSILREADIDIKVENYIIKDILSIREHFKSHPVQVVNIFDPSLLDTLTDFLITTQRYFIFVVNATGKKTTSNSVLKNVVDVDPGEITDFDSYLDLLCNYVNAVKS